MHRRVFLLLPLILAACKPSTDRVAEPIFEGIDVRRIDSRGPFLDPEAPFWEEAPATSVALLPQVSAMPTHPSPAVTEIEVRAVHNGEWIGLRLRWRDPTRDSWIRTAEFGDQVAVQFPIDPAGPQPSPMMGHDGAPVNILQWRAPFQRDLIEGAPQVRDLYPHALVDVYPDEVLRVIDARAYTGALGVDNPVSRPYASPVLDQMAAGWGSLTVKPVQQAEGFGAWKDGEWRVAITCPLLPSHPNDPDLHPGTESSASFAVWEGGNREVGSRKSWSQWIPLRIAK